MSVLYNKETDNTSELHFTKEGNIFKFSIKKHDDETAIEKFSGELEDDVKRQFTSLVGEQLDPLQVREILNEFDWMIAHTKIWRQE